MWYKEKFFKYGLGILLTLLIIFFIGKVDFFLVPFKRFIAILFLPVLIAVLLYYLLRPLVHLVEKLRVPRIIAILLVFIVVISVFAATSFYAGSIIISQLNQFYNDLPRLMDASWEKIAEIINSNQMSFFSAEKIGQQASSALENIIPFLSKSIFGVISTITGIATILIIVPFILFYFLKDDRIFVSYFFKLVPEKYKTEVREVLKDIDRTLATYIVGQGIIAMVIGALMYIGYMFIGVKYALVLAMFTLITSFIPIFGSVIGVLPAIIISLADKPFTAVKILILMVIVQQLEGNLISPHLMGKRLNIHPLTLILLFLVAASLYGFIGMLIAVPTYAIIKVIIINVARLYRLRQPHDIP